MISWRLTRHVTGGAELGRHRRIHGDHHLFLLLHEDVALLDLLIDPLLEGVPEDGGANVHDPLLGNLREVELVRQVEVDESLSGDEGHHLLDAEVLVLRHVQRLHIVVAQVCLPPS